MDAAREINLPKTLRTDKAWTGGAWASNSGFGRCPAGSAWSRSSESNVFPFSRPGRGWHPDRRALFPVRRGSSA